MNPPRGSKKRLQSQIYKIAYEYLTDMVPEHLKEAWEQYFSPDPIRDYISKNFYVRVERIQGPLKKVDV